MKKLKGFTLVECLVALAILGIASLTMAQIYASVGSINRENNYFNESLTDQMKYAEQMITSGSAEDKLDVVSYESPDDVVMERINVNPDGTYEKATDDSNLFSPLPGSDVIAPGNRAGVDVKHKTKPEVRVLIRLDENGVPYEYSASNTKTNRSNYKYFVKK